MATDADIDIDIVLLALSAAGIQPSKGEASALAAGLPNLRAQVALLFSADAYDSDDEPVTPFLPLP